MILQCRSVLFLHLIFCKNFSELFYCCSNRNQFCTINGGPLFVCCALHQCFPLQHHFLYRCHLHCNVSLLQLMLLNRSLVMHFGYILVLNLQTLRNQCPVADFYFLRLYKAISCCTSLLETWTFLLMPLTFIIAIHRIYSINYTIVESLPCS